MRRSPANSLLRKTTSVSSQPWWVTVCGFLSSISSQPGGTRSETRIYARRRAGKGGAAGAVGHLGDGWPAVVGGARTVTCEPASGPSLDLGTVGAGAVAELPDDDRAVAGGFTVLEDHRIYGAGRIVLLQDNGDLWGGVIGILTPLTPVRCPFPRREGELRVTAIAGGLGLRSARTGHRLVQAVISQSTPGWTVKSKEFLPLDDGEVEQAADFEDDAVAVALPLKGGHAGRGHAATAGGGHQAIPAFG